MPAPLEVHKPDEWPDVLTTTQVAGLIGMHRDTVLDWCHRGTLPASRTGTQWRIAAEDVWPLVPPGIRAAWPAGRWRDATTATS